MTISYMIGIVLADGTKTLYRDPRAKVEEDRPGTIFQTPTEAMSVLPLLPWRKCGDGPHEVDAYGKNGEIYFMVPIDIRIDSTKVRRPPTKLTIGIR